MSAAPHGHEATAESHHKEVEARIEGSPDWARGTAIALAVLFAIIGWMSSCREDSKQATAKAEATQAATMKYAAEHPPAPPIIKVGREKKLYKFEADGCVIVYLGWKWDDYPKGGKITFSSVKTGEKVAEDEPGTLHPTWNLPAGDYKICKASDAAWGVEIWQ